MAKNDNDDTYDYEKTRPPMRKGERSIEDSADSDRRPTLPNPGQVLLQKKGKIEGSQVLLTGIHPR